MLKRKSIIILISALLLASVLVGLPNLFPLHRVAAVNRSIALVGVVNAWNFSTTPNPTITVTQGDIVSITLSSGDTMHQFALDVDKDGTKFIGSCPVGDTCSSVFTPSSGTSISITTASLAPGTYTYFCTFHSSMVGSFVVNPSPSVGGTVVPIDRLALVAPYLGLAILIIAATTLTAVHFGRAKRGEEKP